MRLLAAIGLVGFGVAITMIYLTLISVGAL